MKDQPSVQWWQRVLMLGLVFLPLIAASAKSSLAGSVSRTRSVSTGEVTARIATGDSASVLLTNVPCSAEIRSESQLALVKPFTSSSLHRNHLGLNEKWLKGQYQGESRWLYMLPSGAVYAADDFGKRGTHIVATVPERTYSSLQSRTRLTVESAQTRVVLRPSGDECYLDVTAPSHPEQTRITMQWCDQLPCKHATIQLLVE